MPNMIRKSKVLGLVLVAMLTMGIAASAASAKVAQFHSAEEHTILDATATSVQKFTAGGENAIECTAAGTKFTPHTLTQKTTSEVTVTVAVTTGTCSVSGFPVHVDFTTGECDYRFTANGTVHLVCKKEGGSVTLTPTFFGSVCTIHVYPGTYGGVTYGEGTKEGKKDVTVTAAVTGITNNITGGGGLCGPEGHTANGTYSGTATVSGTNTTEEPIDVWWTTSAS